MRNTFEEMRRRLMLALAAVMIAPGRGRAAAAAEYAAGANAEAFVARAFELMRAAIDSGDQGYGAVVVRDGRIIGEAASRVVLDGDPTAHAEMEAIRDAARRSGSRDLGGCTLYSSSPPCPMCEAAAYWAGIDRLVHGSPARDGGRPRLCG
ncbi:MAG TPA: nucleoside deaminase [Gammaproteobacteria bacterium]